MAISAEEQLRIVVSLSANIGPGVRTVMEGLRRLGADAGAAFTRLGERATAALGRIERDAGAVNLPFARLRGLSGEINERLRGIGEATGLREVGTAAREAHEHVRGLHESLSGLLPAAGGLGFLLGLREAAESLRRSAEYSEQLAITSRATGLTATQLGGLQYAGKIAGVDPTMTNRALEYLNRNRGEVAAGGKGSQNLAAIFAGLGATPQMNSSAVLGLVEDRLHNLLAAHQVDQASYLAGKLFGERSGVALLPLLGQGRPELNKQADRASYFGLAPSDRNALAGEEFNKSLKDMDAAVGGLQLTIANKLYPVLAPIIEKTADWIAVNRRWIATDIASEVREFVDAVRGIDWSPAISGLKGLGNAALWATEHFRVVEIGLGTLTAFKLFGLIGQFKTLGTQVSLTVAKLVAIPVAGLISSFVTLIPTIRGLRDVWATLDLAMSANPLGAAIVAAVALGGAAYELYEHWDKVKSFFKDLWAGVVASFEWAWDQIKGLVDKIDGYLPHMPDWMSNLVPGLGAATTAAHALAASSPAHSGVAARVSALAAPGGAAVRGAALAAPIGAGGPLASPLRQSPGAMLATPIYPRRAGGAPATAKVEVATHVIIDHRNPPPGITTRIEQPPPVTVDLGNAWAW